MVPRSNVYCEVEYHPSPGPLRVASSSREDLPISELSNATLKKKTLEPFSSYLGSTSILVVDHYGRPKPCMWYIVDSQRRAVENIHRAVDTFGDVDTYPFSFASACIYMHTTTTVSPANIPPKRQRRSSALVGVLFAAQHALPLANVPAKSTVVSVRKPCHQP